jgi:hypothetical protein
LRSVDIAFSTILDLQKRIKEQMARMKMIEEKKHAPRINPKVAGRFVRNALWDADE